MHRSLRIDVVFVVVVVCLLATTAALGQGGLTDYQRARDMPDLVKDKVLNERLKENWLDEHRLMYRRQTSPPPTPIPSGRPRPDWRQQRDRTLRRPAQAAPPPGRRL